MKKNYKLLLMLSVIFSIAAVGQTPGNSLHFDGSDDYISNPLPTVFSDIAANSITIETWIKPQGNSFSRVVFAQLNSSNFMSMSIGATNQVYFYISNTVGVSTGSSLPLNQWTHVACVWIGSTQQTEIYFNGILQATNSGGSSSTGNDNLMTIGSRTNEAQYFNGELDELRIWDVRRTVCDINSSMHSEFTQSQANLIAYYNFNQGVANGNNITETSLPDFTTNYNGLLNNFTLTGATSNWLNSGAIINQTNQNNSTVYSVDTIITCDSLLWIDGVTYYASNNTATHTFTNGSLNGCDSIVTLNLTLNNNVSHAVAVNVCHDASYIYADGTISNNIIANESHTSIIAGASSNSCDSIITENLNVLPALTSSQTLVECAGFSVTVGTNTYTSTGVYTDVLTAANGCDSTVTTDLTIKQPTTGSQTLVECAGFSVTVGTNTYTSTGVYTDVLTAANGCDSTVTTDLTVEAAIDVTIDNTLAPTLTANQTGATYQWVDCDNGNAPIATETNQSFTATVNGNYAVVVTVGPCSDTSACENITGVGIKEVTSSVISIYPNPTRGMFTISLTNTNEAVSYTITTLEGRIVEQANNVTTNNIEVDLTNESKGVYLLRISDNASSKVYKIIRQ